MSEEDRVMKRFKQDIKEHFQAFEEELKKGDYNYAFAFLMELHAMQDMWKKLYHNPQAMIGNFARGFKVDKSIKIAKEMARKRWEILYRTLEVADDLWKKKSA